MKLQTFLNKFTNDNFLLTVDGWCDEMPFSYYKEERNMDYWKKYKNMEVKSYAILTTNDMPELCIKLV